MTEGGAEGPPSAAALFAALHATWPPLRWHDAPGWRVGAGAGGGQRVSCGVTTGGATVGSDAAPDALAAAQRALGQAPLAMLRPGDEALDARLAAAGWALRDPTLAYAAPVGAVAADPPAVTAFAVEWPPLQVQREVWAAAGIGAPRLAVMDRVAGPKLALLGRTQDRPAAAAFVALHARGGIAVVHALAVAPGHRRGGLATALMRAAALWGRAQGAATLATFVTEDNAPARALQEGLGLRAVARYHYRALPG